jgi:hypothetical protein
MTTQDIVILAVAAAIGIVALVGALAAWRVLGRAGAGLRAAADGLNTRAELMPDQLAGVRAQLNEVNTQVEHTLWMLGEFDDRIDRASVDLRAKRVASDSLRLRLLQGRLTIARIRRLVQLLTRLGELRRAFL